MLDMSQQIDEQLRNIAYHIIKFRERENLSQEAFGRLAGITTPTVRALEQARSPNVSRNTLLKIADAIGMTVLELQSAPSNISNLTEDGATLTFRKPRAKKPATEDDQFSVLMKRLNQAPTTEDELQWARYYKRSDRLRKAGLLFLVCDTEDLPNHESKLGRWLSSEELLEMKKLKRGIDRILG